MSNYDFVRTYLRKGMGLLRDDINWVSREQFVPIYESDDADVFIAGYPKSGNTWMQHLIAGMVYGIDTIYMPGCLVQTLVPDVHKQRYYKRYSTPCVFKSHALPDPRYRRVIHLVRDGRDAMASYYAMNQALDKGFTLEEMVYEGKGLFPCKWHEHTEAWLSNPYDADLIVVRYEDLLSSTHEQMVRIRDFMGLDRSDELIDRAIRGCTFDQMRRREEEYGLHNMEWPAGKRFVRKGQAGAFKTELPEAVTEYFESESRHCLEQFGYLDVMANSDASTNGLDGLQ